MDSGEGEAGGSGRSVVGAVVALGMTAGAVALCAVGFFAAVEHLGRVLPAEVPRPVGLVLAVGGLVGSVLVGLLVTRALTGAHAGCLTRLAVWGLFTSGLYVGLPQLAVFLGAPAPDLRAGWDQLVEGGAQTAAEVTPLPEEPTPPSIPAPEEEVVVLPPTDRPEEIEAAKEATQVMSRGKGEGKVWSWTDKDGNVHVTSEPPPGEGPHRPEDGR